jgi:aldehyde dehydrogenase (NAD+)/phenylacetaldehyde dehydrogenase
MARSGPLARERLLHRLADAMEADLPRLAALEALDTGKPLAIAETVDIPAAIGWLRSYAGWPGKIAGRAGTLGHAGRLPCLYAA